MGETSLSDIAAVAGANNGGGAWMIWILLFVVLLGGGFNNRGDYGQYATAASQQDILFSSKFQALDNKIDRIGNGIADATFALNNTVIAEGRNTQNILCDIKSTIHTEGEATRSLIAAQENQRLRDELGQARAANNDYQQSQYILGQIGRWYSNPPCYGTGCGCCNAN